MIQKHVLITGASSGIGLATALRLSRKGYAVIGTATDAAKSKAKIEEKIAESLPFELISLDLTEKSSIVNFIQAIDEKWKHIDILINNAGLGELGSVEDSDMDQSRRLFEVNYWGPVQLVKHFVESMRIRQEGIIIQMGSIVHDLQFPFKAQYCASKSALSGFTLSLRQELAPYGIRVHLLEPGWVRSEFHSRMKVVANPDGPYLERLKPFLNYSRDTNPHIPDGEEVAALIEKVIEDKQSPVRIAVGREARRFRLVRRFLSNQMLDRILRWKLNRKQTF